MIDWNEQWALHSPGFLDGRLRVNCETPFELIAGPGFGDLSHPTTNLMLNHMAPFVKGKNVIDIGCGSGVLSIAAHLMGAKSVYGIDICPNSVLHARENAKLNSLTIEFSTKPITHLKDAVVLMNMISSEQAKVWDGFISIAGVTFLLSGFLEEEAVAYETQAVKDGWKLCVAHHA